MSWFAHVRRKVKKTRESASPPTNGDSDDSASESPELDLTLIEELPGVLESLNDSTKRFNDVAQDQNQAILEQSSTLHQLAATSEEFVVTSRRIAENADSVETFAVRSLEGCEKGKDTLGKASRNLDLQGREVASLVENIRKLGEHNRLISGIAEIISEITSQLDLLALNAQIEAAGAGTAGRRFMTVALEVKRLADTSQESTDHIQRVVRKVMEDIRNLVASAQKGMEATQDALSLMGSLSQDLADIHEEVAQTREMAREIKISTHQQTSAQEEMSQSVTDLDRLATNNAGQITSQLGEAITQLSDLSQYLTLILESTVLKDFEEDEADDRTGIATELLQ